MNAILLPIDLAIIKMPEHSKLEFLETKINHLADISTKNATLKGTSNSQTSVTVQRDNSPMDNLLRKTGQRIQQLASKKENQDWKSNKCLFNKKIKLLFKPNNNLVLPKILTF